MGETPKIIFSGIKMNKTGSRVDMLNGPLLKKIIIYTIPIILSGILQLAYNAADTIVVGQFAENSKNSLAAVGATASLMNLFVNICLGLSTGANVVVARYYGAGAKEEVHKAVHTAFAVGIIGGIVASVLGFIFTPTLLRWTACPEAVIGKSILYMRICFCGVTFQMIYNFVAGIARASGETNKPFIILVISGAVNVVLNLIFVIVFRLDVAGVAIATAISNVLSAVLGVILLLRIDDCIKLDLSKIHIYADKMKEIVRIGVPSMIQSMTFTLSNMILQSAINSAGDTVMAACTAAGSIEQFVYIPMNAFYHTSLAFVGQNYAAKKYDRVRESMFICLGLVTVVGLVIGWLAVAFSEPLMKIYVPKAEDIEVVHEGMKRMLIIAGSYFTCGILDVLVGTLRGMGISFIPMVSSIIGVCGIRFTWILGIYPFLNNTIWLYLAYTISWIITDMFHAVTLAHFLRKFGIIGKGRKKSEPETELVDVANSGE